MPETPASAHTKNAARSNALTAFPGSLSAAISIAPLPPAARFSLRLRPAAAAQLRSAAGFLLDMPINRCIVSGARTSLRLGPDEWLLLGADGEALARELGAALGGVFFSLVDVSHRNVAFAIAGPRAREVLNGGCPLDLHESAFPAGYATRTILGKAEIILCRAASDLTYRVECWRSFAPYVHGLLKDVAREFEAE